MSYSIEARTYSKELSLRGVALEHKSHLVKWVVVCPDKRKRGAWGLKVFQFLIRLFFVSGVVVLRLSEGPFGIGLSMVSMGKQEGVGNLGGKRRVWGWVVESNRERLGYCEI